MSKAAKLLFEILLNIIDIKYWLIILYNVISSYMPIFKTVITANHCKYYFI